MISATALVIHLEYGDLIGFGRHQPYRLTCHETLDAWTEAYTKGRGCNIFLFGTIISVGEDRDDSWPFQPYHTYELGCRIGYNKH